MYQVRKRGEREERESERERVASPIAELGKFDTKKNSNKSSSHGLPGFARLSPTNIVPSGVFLLVLRCHRERLESKTALAEAIC